MHQLELLINSKIRSIVRICDLIKISFESNEKEMCLHVQKALFRVCEYDSLLISSWDMGIPSKSFKKSLFKRFKWDIPGNTLFDDEIKNNENKLLNVVVKNILSNGKDLILQLEDNIRIEVFVDTLKSDYEIYRVFEVNNLESHFVIET